MTRGPNPLPWIYRWRTNLIQMPLFVLVTVFCGSLSLFVSLFERSGRLQHRIACIWSRLCVFISGSSLLVEGAENLTKYPVSVFASNHTSYMDIPVLFSSIPVQFRIMAKQELWPIPFIGWYLNRSGQLPIDTRNSRATLSSLGKAAKTLRSNMSLFVFPEGGRTADGKLRPFLSGAAYLAIRAQVPLVPIALIGVYDLLPIHTHHYYPCELRMKVGEPIPTEGMTTHQLEELTAVLRERIARMLGELPEDVFFSETKFSA